MMRTPSLAALASLIATASTTTAITRMLRLELIHRVLLDQTPLPSATAVRSG